MADEVKTISNKSFKEYSAEAEVKLEEIFGKKAPQLPEGAKEFIVKIAPYLAIIGIVFSIPAVLAVLGLSAIVAPFAALGGLNSFAGFSVSMIFLIINVILEAMAIPGLFSRSMKAWRLMYYSTIMSGVSSLLSMNLGSLIIGLAVGFYILFQVKSYYK